MRKRTPTLYVKLTRSIQVTFGPNVQLTQPLHVTLNDFAEHINLAPNFERVRVLRQNVRIYPQQNVSNSSTSRVGGYCIYPYHKPLPTTPPNYPTALSIDKAKIYRGTSVGRMSFVPAARLAAEDATATANIRTDWKPTFEIGAGATTPILYTGAITFENLGILLGPSSFYTIIQDLHVVYKNQRSFI